MKGLDLFCGAGGASRGYTMAGWTMVGVDKNPQPEYPYEFIQANALDILKDKESIKQFSFIHASPPCQRFTKYKNLHKDIGDRYEDLIEQIRELLKATGKPYVIENVEGSPLSFNSIMLCGSMFGLDVRRHRLFEASFHIPQPKCNHSVWKPDRFPGGRSRQRGGHSRALVRATVEVGSWDIPIKVQQKAMGLKIKNLRMLSEAIPPAYTKYVGKHIC